MSRELQRIQRLRNLRVYHERAAERALGLARREAEETAQALTESRDAFTKAADESLGARETTAPDFEMERLYVATLSREVVRAEAKVEQARGLIDKRLIELGHAHREVEKIERWSDMTRAELREHEARMDRVESDEIAARLSAKS